MIYKTDKLRPTQPYFVIDTIGFKQEIYLRQGISHFYSFRADKGKKLRVVPDGCADLFFEYGDDFFECYVCGTPLKYRADMAGELLDKKTNEVFGVRFMPGVMPAFINTTMRDITDSRISLESVVMHKCEWIDELSKEKDFYQRIRIFIQGYTGEENKKVKPFGKREIVQSVKTLIYDTNGKIKISEIAEKCGYSERYINKVFNEEMGFTPKAFCKIIQFQRSLEYLNYGTPESMTDAAVELGYYDQPQFIRDFKCFCGITPKKYLNMIGEAGYKSLANGND